MSDNENSFRGWSVLKVSNLDLFLGRLAAAVYCEYQGDASASDSPQVMWEGIRDGRIGYETKSEKVLKQITEPEAQALGYGAMGFMATSYTIGKINDLPISDFTFMTDHLNIVAIESGSLIRHPDVVSEAAHRSREADPSFTMEIFRTKPMEVPDGKLPYLLDATGGHRPRWAVVGF
jgi:hypothetical protein